MCLIGVWKVSWRCFDSVWNLGICFEVSEKGLEGILKGFGRGLIGIWKVSESCQKSVLKVRIGPFGTG